MHEVNSAFSAIWLAVQLGIALHYSPPKQNDFARIFSIELNINFITVSFLFNYSMLKQLFDHFIRSVSRARMYSPHSTLRLLLS